jgi:hypothetical protein
MNPLLSGALFTALSPLALAGGTEASSDWLGLDEELNAVASNVSLQGGGVELGALFRGGYVMADGTDFNGFADGNGDGNPDDQLGMVVDDAEIWLQGTVGNYFWRFNVDFGTQFSPYFIGGLIGTGAGTSAFANTTRTDTLEDAFIDWRFSDQFSLRLGHFILPTTFSAASNPDSLLMLGRTTSGEYFHNYDFAAMLSGDYEQFQWHLAVANGFDGTGDEQRLFGRAIYNLGGGQNATEGALGADENMNAAIGATFWDDGTVDDSDVVAFDLSATVGQISFSGEFVTYGDAHATAAAGTFAGATNLGYTAGDGPSVWGLTVSYLLNEEWEIAARLEDLDDLSNTEIMSFGLNYYQLGHNAKWQLMLMDVSSDVATNEGSVIALGVTVGSNG